MKDWTMLRIIILTGLAAIALTIFYKLPALVGLPSANHLRVIAVFKMTDFSNTFWRSVRDGCLSAAADENIEVQIKGPLDENSVEEQIKTMEDAIAEKPNAIILAASDYTRLVPVVRAATARGIPVISVDSFINTDDAVCRIGTDNLAAGRACAHSLLTQIPANAKIAIFSYTRDSSTAIERERGLRESLGHGHPLLPTEYGNADSETSYRQARRILRDNPGLAGMVALNEPTLQGVAQALRESGQSGSVALIGIDSSLKILKYLEAGVIRSTIVQQPFNMGYRGIAIVRTVLTGGKIEKFYDTGIANITRATMFSSKNQKLLFPFNDNTH